MLTALTFNVLAPNFAAPKYYPPIDNIYLSQHFRRSATTKFLNNIADTRDIIAFQEVTHDTIINNEICRIRICEYNYFNDLLSMILLVHLFLNDFIYFNSGCSVVIEDSIDIKKNGEFLSLLHNIKFNDVNECL